jgi:hypothetical protein
MPARGCCEGEDHETDADFFSANAALVDVARGLRGQDRTPEMTRTTERDCSEKFSYGQ